MFCQPVRKVFYRTRNNFRTICRSKSSGHIRQHNDNKSANIAATRQIKSIYTHNGNAKQREQNKSTMLQRAFEIYNGVGGQPDDMLVSTMMRCLMTFGEHQSAMKLYDDTSDMMHGDISHLNYLKCCISTNGKEQGLSVMAQISLRCENSNPRLLCTMIDFHSHFGYVDEAWKVFHSIPSSRKNKVTLNTMMKCLSSNQLNNQALSLFRKNKDLTDDISHLLAIKACVQLNDIRYGQSIIERLGTLKHRRVELLNTIIDFHGSIGDSDNVRSLFREINYRKRDSITLNSTMKALGKCNDYGQSLQLYEEHPHLRDDISHLLAIKACIHINDIEKGRTIINAIYDPENKDQSHPIELIHSMIDFCAISGDFELAEDFFHSIALRSKSLITIHSIMRCYFINQRHNECLNLFHVIKTDDSYSHITPDAVTYVFAIKSAAQSISFYSGAQIYESLNRESATISENLNVQIALLTLFGKYAEPEKCKMIFQEIQRCHPRKFREDLSIWNSMMNAFARNGDIAESIMIWERMKSETNIVSDYKTFCILLNGCNHCGDTEQATHIWNGIEDENIKFGVEVIAVFIDCLSRKGLLREAFRFLMEKDTIISATNSGSQMEIVWVSLLGGCRKFGDKEMAEQVYAEMERRFGHKAEFMTPASVLLSNVYGALDEMDIVEASQKECVAVPGAQMDEDYAVGCGNDNFDSTNSQRTDNIHRFPSITKLIGRRER